MKLKSKTNRLRKIFQEMESVVIGFSGGVDSTLVVKVAHDVLGDRALAVIGDSESLLPSELREAKDLVETLNIPYQIVSTEELSNPNYSDNPSNRCFFCKDELFSQLRDLARASGYRFVADGVNKDDFGDYRPGLKAATDHKVRHPLQEAGFNKEDIRSLAKELGLPNWDKPALACLASRFPYGTKITAEKLAIVGAAEESLKAKGFQIFRVRHHESGSDTIARIELSADDLNRFLDPQLRQEVDKELRDIGYHYVTIDLQAYRSGRLNESLGSSLIQIQSDLQG